MGNFWEGGDPVDAEPVGHNHVTFFIWSFMNYI